ncbi:MAG: hypothetical protein R3F49_24070 [Planctomycetota bacterium]
MKLIRTLAFAALSCVPLAAQQVAEWNAASRALPGEVSPAYGLYQSAPCGSPTTLLANDALTIDTSACLGQIQSYQYVRSPATSVAYPSVMWAEARVRLHPSVTGPSPAWGVTLSLYPGPACPYSLTIREGAVSLFTFGAGVLGSVPADTTSSPRTWRVELDTVAAEVRVSLDGQVVLAVPPVTGAVCSFAPGFFGGVYFGDLSGGSAAIADWHSVRHNLGVPELQFCTLPALNSAGRRASLQTSGSLSVAQNDFRLTVVDAPPNSFGYLLCSRLRNVAPVAAAGQGLVCLAAPVGRINRSGEVLTTNTAGTATLPLDLTSMPQPSGAVPAMQGEHWSFQFWYRDANPGPTSNLSSGLQVHFE